MSLHRLATIAMAMNGGRAYACQRAAPGGWGVPSIDAGESPAVVALVDEHEDPVVLSPRFDSAGCQQLARAAR
jgi:hypothetical protein